MKVPVYTTLLDEQNTMLVKEKELEYKYDGKFTDPETIVAMMTEAFHMDQRAEEYVYLLAFDNQLNLIGVSEVFHGTVSASFLSPREIYVRACLMGACSVVIVHNHPSQSAPTPSTEDFASTKRVISAGKIINIPLNDHMIIGRNGTYYSFYRWDPGLFA